MGALLGMALDCALGRTLEGCVAALRTDRVPCGRVELDDFGEPFRSAYYRIDDGLDLLDPDRVGALLPPVVEAALEQAGLSIAERRAMPVFVGSSCFGIARAEAGYRQALRADASAAEPMGHVGFEGIGRLAARVAGSEAQTFAWHTACTSAANAVLAAQRMLAAGAIAHALVVGVELANRTSLSGFAALQLTADAVSPFDAKRAGIVLGEGVGALVLGRADAGAPLCIRGGAANSDAYSVTGADPDGGSIAAVQARALAQAGCDAADVRAIKAHGTGTPANDAAEARGMRRVFEPLPAVCALKPRLGHTLGACGVTELALFAGTLAAGFVPGTPGFAQVDPELGVEPLRAARPAAAGTYLVNQFGFGGSNTSLVLECA